jgi:carbon storage regulator
MIGDNIVINVVEVQGDNVRIAIDAPRDIKIYRGEIYRAIQEKQECGRSGAHGFGLKCRPAERISS